MNRLRASAGFKRALWIFVKYGLSIFCLVCAFKDVPFSDLAAALSRYPVLPMFGVLAASFSAYAVMGLRLSYMTAPPLSFRSTFCAALVGLAVNNVLPAKAGEVVKALWMGRENGVTFQKTLGIVFMERFFDVNVLALLSLWFLWIVGERGAVAAFVACLAAGWCVLILFRLSPRRAERFTRFFGEGALGRFVFQVLAGVLENMSPGRIAWLSVTSLSVWWLYGAQMALCVNGVARLGLPWDAVVSIFAVSGLSMLLPSSPGAIGVYEVFTMTALKRFGVSADEALALTLFSHMAQFIPVTLAGGALFAVFPVKRTSNGINID